MFFLQGVNGDPKRNFQHAYRCMKTEELPQDFVMLIWSRTYSVPCRGFVLTFCSGNNPLANLRGEGERTPHFDRLFFLFHAVFGINGVFGVDVPVWEILDPSLSFSIVLERKRNAILYLLG